MTFYSEHPVVTRPRARVTEYEGQLFRKCYRLDFADVASLPQVIRSCEFLFKTTFRLFSYTSEC